MDDLFALQRPIKYKLGRGHCLTKLEEMDSLMFRVEKKSQQAKPSGHMFKFFAKGPYRIGPKQGYPVVDPAANTDCRIVCIGQGTSEFYRDTEKKEWLCYIQSNKCYSQPNNYYIQSGLCLMGPVCTRYSVFLVISMKIKTANDCGTPQFIEKDSCTSHIFT